MRRSLSKKEILRNKKDIDRIFRQGKHFTCKGMRLVIIDNSLGFDRFIVIPAKKYGNSVERNRLRRRMKEIFRLSDRRTPAGCCEEKKGYDIALVVYPGKVSSYSLLESGFNSLLDRVEGK